MKVKAKINTKKINTKIRAIIQSIFAIVLCLTTFLVLINRSTINTQNEMDRIFQNLEFFVLIFLSLSMELLVQMVFGVIEDVFAGTKNQVSHGKKEKKRQQVSTGIGTNRTRTVNTLEKNDEPKETVETIKHPKKVLSRKSHTHLSV